MKRLHIIAVIVCLVIGAFAIFNAQNNNDPVQSTSDLNWNTNFNSALSEAKQENKQVLIDFYADWCGACQQLDQDTFSDAKVKEKLNQNYVLLKVDIDTNPELASQYQIYSVPTIVIIDSEGQEVRRQEGYFPPDQFLNFI